MKDNDKDTLFLKKRSSSNIFSVCFLFTGFCESPRCGCWNKHCDASEKEGSGRFHPNYPNRIMR